jgi:glucokinase
MMQRLIGDIGGTNTRLALVRDGTAWSHMQSFRNEEHESLEAIVELYLRSHEARPDAAALAVAGPVRGDRVRLTNRGWMIDAKSLKRRFSLEFCRVVNDFSAVAMGIPALEDDVLEQMGGDRRNSEAPVAIVGPGTGLGVGGIVPGRGGGRILVTEGGHASLPANDDQQAALLACLRRRFGHVSCERAISGQGIENLYQALSEIQGLDAAPLSAAEIGEAATGRNDTLANETLELFFRLLGAVAGDLALSYGAFGGVYLAGGIVPRYLPRFRDSGFRQAFEAKGRMSDYLKPVPVFVILHEEVELLGLAASLDARARGMDWPHVP